VVCPEGSPTIQLQQDQMQACYGNAWFSDELIAAIDETFLAYLEAAGQ
jgi:hypothetical protein